MYGNTYGAWMRAGMDAWSLGLESSSVIGLRMARIAAGGRAGSDEALLMVSEKIRAGIEMQTDLLSGAFGLTPLSRTQNTLRHYRGKVAANRKRLDR